MVRNYLLRRAFTLTELLVALAIVAVLSAILFPVFRSARDAALKATCISNFRQVTLATQIYLDDYSDTFPIVNYDVANLNNPEKDRTWVQTLMPYTNGMGVFTCPGDFGQRKRGEGAFDIDLVVGDPYKRFYSASLRSNVGYNYLYFSPVFLMPNGTWRVQTRNISEIADPSNSILYVDSVYGRTPSGIPVGGGSYIVIPPCRFQMTAVGLQDTFNLNSATAFSPNSGWSVTNPNSQFRYGLAWPWHLKKLNISKVGGGSQSIRVDSLTEGCDVRDNWSGWIMDTSKYAWDGT